MDLKVVKNFPGYENIKEKVFLEDMALKGYILSDYRLFRYYFKKCESKKVIYQPDFRILKKKEQEIYLSFIDNDSDWQFTCKVNSNYWYYTEIENPNYEISLFSTNSEKVSMYKRKIISGLTMFWMPILTLVFYSLMRDNKIYEGYQTEIILVSLSSIVLIVVNIKYIFKYVILYLKTRKSISE